MKEPRTYAVVSPEAAKQQPYPYVLINDDGTYRELTDDEKQHLETKYHPCDGARPYVKYHYWYMAPRNIMSGYLKRSLLPMELKQSNTPFKRKFWHAFSPVALAFIIIIGTMLVVLQLLGVFLEYYYR